MFKGILSSLVLLALGIQSSTFLASQHWIFELSTHFPYYYVLIGSAILAGLLKNRMWRHAVVMVMLVSINLAALGPYFPTQRAQDGNFKLMSSNVLRSNPTPGSVKTVVEAEKPDLLLLVESTVDYSEGFPDYPFFHQTEERSAMGMAMLSKEPATFETIYLAGRPAIHASVSIKGIKTEIIGIHPPPPVSAAYAAERNAALNELDLYMEEIKNPVIVLGDFNITPWSPYYKEFMERTPLKDARLHFGLKNSWQTLRWWTPKIPIDHILVDPSFYVTRFKTANVPGSDHRAVIAELGI